MGSEAQDGRHEHSLAWREMLRIALVALAAAAVWWRAWEPSAGVSVIGVPGLLMFSTTRAEPSQFSGVPHHIDHGDPLERRQRSVGRRHAGRGA